MQPLTSAITGALEQAERAQRSTGPQLGEGMSGGQLTVNESEIRKWLVGQGSAKAVDAALQASLTSSLGVEVSPKVEHRFPEDGKPYTVTVGYEITALEGVSGAIQKTRAAMTGPTKEQAENWLGSLQTATAGARKSEMESEFALDLFSGALMRYPADVAMETCKNLALSTKWFPTLSDIIKEADRLVSPRQALLHSLENWRGADPAEELQAKRRTLQIEITELRRRAGPGPTTDTGPRGDILAEIKRLGETLAGLSDK